ncbi:unnamed protein product [Rotaria magnacalcarata]|uniref:Peptidase S1 domain-containing protein n=1 Tax=Rotaria magnacalcarata TaxID=392030 RepID=A0A819PVB0_9BILA|nr:unnamed protein product [Rotaria magnacalcarata]
MIYILFMCTIVQYVGVHGDDYDQIRHYSSMHHNMQQFYHPPTSYFRHYTHNNPPQSIFLRNWLLANNADALSMQNCGISPATNIYQRIVGGRPTMPYAYPWMVFLTIESIDGKFECAGALLTRLHVLTAAHCVTKSEYPKAVTVKAGWSSVAIGWGCTSWNDCQTQTLQEANLPILHANIPPCTQHMIYPPGQICAGNFKCVAGTCKGDSGGPLMIQNANYRWEVIGITSCDDKW